MVHTYGMESWTTPELNHGPDEEQTEVQFSYRYAGDQDI